MLSRTNIVNLYPDEMEDIRICLMREEKFSEQEQ